MNLDPGARARVVLFVGSGPMKDVFDKREKQRRYLVVLAWLGLLLYVAFVPGSGVDGLYQCPFHVMTGFDCPGCGMTRASIHAVQLDFWESVSYHPFGVVFVIGLTLLALLRSAELIKGGPIDFGPLEPSKKLKSRLWLAVLVVAMAFGIGRLLLEIAGILTPL